MDTKDLNINQESENNNSPASENQTVSGENTKQIDPISEESAPEKAEIVPQDEESQVESNLTDNAKSEFDEKSADMLSHIMAEQEELMVPSDSPYDEEVDDVAPDYSALSYDQLVAELSRLLADFKINKIRNKVEAIKNQFYKKHQHDLAKAKNTYIEENGSDDGFKFVSGEYEAKFNELIQKYKAKRVEFAKDIEKQKKDNLEAKYQIIEEIKKLINNEESLNKTFVDFKKLQDKWHAIGKVPQTSVKKLWEKYHFVVEQFYDYVKINKELRDLDFKKNQEAKEELCKNAEALILEESVVKAFKKLQDYHQKWREVGPVPRELKEELWNRFKEATFKVNKRHQDFFENLKKEQVKNLEAKEALCKRVEEINKLNLVKSKKWEDKSAEVVEIQKLWKKIGFAPKKNNNEIYQRFKKACDAFFDAKREYFSAKHSEEQRNLEIKTALCEKAESLQDSTQWKETTAELIKLQKQWKETGPVLRRNSEAIWRRFRAACDHFFEAKKNFFAGADERQTENLELKKQLIQKVKDFELTDNDEADLKKLSDFQKEWSEIGYVPFNQKEKIQKEFRQAINKHFDSMKIEDGKRNVMNFRNKIENWLESPRLRSKIIPERNKIINKIKDLENEITLYENNIGFFSNSKTSNALIAEIKQKIERAKDRIQLFREKLKIIEQIEKEQNNK